MDHFKIVALHGNPHIGEHIAEAIHSGYLWEQAVPRHVVAGFDSCPHPTHLVFASHQVSPTDAQLMFDRWCSEQGS